VRSVSADTLHALPALLGDAGSDHVDAIGLLDEQLLLILRAARLLPKELDLVSEEQS
jgi:chemotaxis signal transduction protein